MDEAHGVLRLATWNVWWRFGEWEHRLELITACLRRLRPDIVTLQEVWEDDDRSQAAEIAGALGMHYRYAWRLDVGVRLGNAILTRSPILASDYVPLSGLAERDLLGTALAVTVESGQAPVSVVTTHLEYARHASSTRQRQVIEVLELAQRFRTHSYPLLLTGDLNALPDSQEIRQLTGRTQPLVEGLAFYDAWEFADPAELGHTRLCANPNVDARLGPPARLDFILVESDEARGEVGMPREVGLLGGADDDWPSDHLGVWADLRTRPE